MTGKRILTHAATEFGTIHTGHHPVANDDTYLMLLQQVECLDTVACSQDGILITEAAFEELTHIFGVIDD